MAMALEFEGSTDWVGTIGTTAAVITPWLVTEDRVPDSSMIAPAMAATPPAVSRASRLASITPPAAAAVLRPGSFTQAKG